MISGSFFFAVSGKEIFYCRALAQTNEGLRARCLNRNFEAIVDDDGYLHLPRANGRRARVELIVSAEVQQRFDTRDHGAAIAYFLRRRAVKSEGIA
jgi:hypothetical protein